MSSSPCSLGQIQTTELLVFCIWGRSDARASGRGSGSSSGRPTGNTTCSHAFPPPVTHGHTQHDPAALDSAVCPTPKFPRASVALQAIENGSTGKIQSQGRMFVFTDSSCRITVDEIYGTVKVAISFSLSRSF